MEIEIDEDEKILVINYLKKYGLYDLIQQLFFKQYNWPCFKKYGHFKIIKWLSSANLNLNWNNDVCNLLVKKNALSSLKFLQNNGDNPTISPDIFLEVCRDRNLKMLQFLHENKTFNINSSFPMSEAARANDDQTVIFLYEKGYKYTSLVNEWAVYYNNYDLVQYLYEKNKKSNMARIKYTMITFIIAIIVYFINIYI